MAKDGLRMRSRILPLLRTVVSLTQRCQWEQRFQHRVSADSGQIRRIGLFVPADEPFWKAIKKRRHKRWTGLICDN
jgi:hypothetical protein